MTAIERLRELMTSEPPAGRGYRALFMAIAMALYMGTAYWLEGHHASGAIIVAVFAAQGAACAFLLPAVLRRYRWSAQLKCAAAMAWIIGSATAASAAGVHGLPARERALALLAWLAVVVLLYVLHFRRRCPD